MLPQSPAESPDLCFIPPPLAQAPPQAYTEAYAKAQALARNGFEEAKHCLQEHILETINVFKDKCVSAEQASVKEVNVFTSVLVIYKSMSNLDFNPQSYASRGLLPFVLFVSCRVLEPLGTWRGTPM